jgi:hypothetical protein
MSIKFRVEQPFNFSQYNYIVVFNTTGDGVTPFANGQQNNYRGYSFALVVGGTAGSATVHAYQYFRPPGSPNFQLPQLLQLYPTPQQLQYIPNSNGQGTEYTVIFDRRIFFGIATPSPGPSSSASPSPSPSPSSSPTPTATPFGTVWNFNFFVGSQTYIPVDSLGQGGATDSTYQSAVLDTTQVFDTGAFFAAPHVAPPNDPAATITGGDIANNP